MTDIHDTLHLINQVKTGEDTALNLLLNRYLSRIQRIVRARLGPKLRTKMESMDVVQEVLIRTIKSFENFTPKDEAAFLHWLSQLVSNQIRDMADYHQAEKRNLDEEYVKKSNVDCSVLGQVAANSIYKPSMALSLKEDVLKLEAALDQLDENNREIIIMRQYEELSFKDIGEQLGLSEDAARMQFGRAMARLTNLME